MIRIYSEPMTAVEVIQANRETVVKAEDTNPPKSETRGTEYEIHFYGDLAEEVAQAIIPGAMFTFRGFMENQRISARAYMLVA